MFFKMVEWRLQILRSTQRISLPVAVTSPGTASELNTGLRVDSISVGELYF